MVTERPTLFQAIKVIIRHRAERHPEGITQREIAEATYGEGGYQQLVNMECDRLARMGYIKRDDGSGGARYLPGRR